MLVNVGEVELNNNGTDHFVMQDTTISSQTEPEKLRVVQLTAMLGQLVKMEFCLRMIYVIGVSQFSPYCQAKTLKTL